jgi:hypothetical protein
LVSKKQRLELDAKKLQEEADALAEDAEKEGQMLLLTKSNAIRKASTNKLSEADSLVMAIANAKTDLAAAQNINI